MVRVPTNTSAIYDLNIKDIHVSSETARIVDYHSGVEIAPDAKKQH